MAAKKKAMKRKAVARGKKVARPAARKGAGRKAKAPARSAKRKVAARPKARSKGRKAASRKAPSTPISVTTATLSLVQFEPLRTEAVAALSRGETVELRTGTGEEGGRVETLVFAPSGKAVQSLGVYVHRGDWNGERLLTDKAHLLDPDGCCFCRDCETAGGYTLDDDE